MCNDELKCLDCGRTLNLSQIQEDKKIFTVCYDCSEAKENALRRKLDELLSEEQKQIFKEYQDIVNYSSSYLILAS